jgi:hypothetical protein
VTSGNVVFMNETRNQTFLDEGSPRRRPAFDFPPFPVRRIFFFRRLNRRTAACQPERRSRDTSWPINIFFILFIILYYCVLLLLLLRWRWCYHIVVNMISLFTVIDGKRARAQTADVYANPRGHVEYIVL